MSKSIRPKPVIDIHKKLSKYIERDRPRTHIFAAVSATLLDYDVSTPDELVAFYKSLGLGTIMAQRCAHNLLDGKVWKAGTNKFDKCISEIGKQVGIAGYFSLGTKLSKFPQIPEPMLTSMGSAQIFTMPDLNGWFGALGCSPVERVRFVQLIVKGAHIVQTHRGPIPTTAYQLLSSSIPSIKCKPVVATGKHLATARLLKDLNRVSPIASHGLLEKLSIEQRIDLVEEAESSTLTPQRKYENVAVFGRDYIDKMIHQNPYIDKEAERKVGQEIIESRDSFLSLAIRNRPALHFLADKIKPHRMNIKYNTPLTDSEAQDLSKGIRHLINCVGTGQKPAHAQSTEALFDFISANTLWPKLIEILKTSLSSNTPEKQEFQSCLATYNGSIDRLVRGNMRFIRYKIPVGNDACSFLWEDMFQEAFIACGHAAQKWDPRIGSRFSTYARHDIERVIEKKLEQGQRQVSMSRDNKGEIKKLFRLERDFVLKNQDTPSYDWLANQMGCTPDRVAELKQASAPELNLQNQKSDEDDRLYEETIPDPGAGPEQTTVNNHAKERFWSFINKTLPAKQIEVLQVMMGCGVNGPVSDKALKEYCVTTGTAPKEVARAKAAIIKTLQTKHMKSLLHSFDS